MPERVEPAQTTWRFRCSVCGDGAHLNACAQAIVTGRLLSDATIGSYVEESDSDHTDLFHDSIECELHPLPEGRIEEFIDGRWTYEAPCPGGPDDYRLKYHDDATHLVCERGWLMRYGQQGRRHETCHGSGVVNVPVEVPVNA